MFRPQLLDSLRNYDRATFLSDLTAGITVAVVALPLSIAFGIAAGATPAQGLWTAIIAGVLISALGGSKVLIGGPTGAFVPIAVSIIATYGLGGLALATIMAGFILIAMGLMKLGRLIKFIPYPVTAGFTSGIAGIIFLGQIKDFLGLTVEPPRDTPHRVLTLIQHATETQWPSLGLGLLTLIFLILWPKLKWVQKIPASLVALLAATGVAMLFHLNAPTIGSKFGEFPRGFPHFSFPEISFVQVHDLLIPAMTIAMLGAMQSLFSAMVADGMIESHHDSNQELMAQGVTNIVCPLFGGIPATGAIARTLYNIRAGGKTPVTGIVHAVVLLGIVLLVAPWCQYVPLSALSAVLFVVCYRMGEWDNFLELARGPKSDFGVLLATFGLTIIFDLTIAVGVGLTMTAALFVRRMEEISHIRLVTPETEMEIGAGSIRDKVVPEGAVIYRIEGPFFFGAAEKLEAALGQFAVVPRVVIFRMRNVPAIDATGLHALEVMLDKFRRKGTKLVLSGVQPQPMKVLFNAGFVDKIGLDNICGNIDVALIRARQLLGETPPPG